MKNINQYTQATSLDGAANELTHQSIHASDIADVIRAGPKLLGQLHCMLSAILPRRTLDDPTRIHRYACASSLSQHTILNTLPYTDNNQQTMNDIDMFMLSLTMTSKRDMETIDQR